MSDPRFFRKYLDILSESPVSEQETPAAPTSYYDQLSDSDKARIDRRIGWTKRNFANVKKMMGPHEDPEVEELFQQSRDWVEKRQTDPERAAKLRLQSRQRQQELRNQPKPPTDAPATSTSSTAPAAPSTTRGSAMPSRSAPAMPVSSYSSLDSFDNNTSWDNDIEIDSKFDKYPNAKAEIQSANKARNTPNPNIVVRKPGTKDEDW
jgi:hypothetical protein